MSFGFLTKLCEITVQPSCSHLCLLWVHVSCNIRPVLPRAWSSTGVGPASVCAGTRKGSPGQQSDPQAFASQNCNHFSSQKRLAFTSPWLLVAQVVLCWLQWKLLLTCRLTSLVPSSFPALRVVLAFYLLSAVLSLGCSSCMLSWYFFFPFISSERAGLANPGIPVFFVREGVLLPGRLPPFSFRLGLYIIQSTLSRPAIFFLFFGSPLFI